MKIKNNSRWIILTLTTLLIVSCNSLFDNYEDESYAMDGMDEQLCTLIDTDSLLIVRNSLTFTDTLSSTIEDSIYWLLEDSTTLIAPSVTNGWLIYYPAEVSYLVLKLDEDSNTIFATNTSGGYKLVYSDGTVVVPVSTMFPLETIAECPTIRTRDEYELSQGYYILSLNRESEGTLKITMINN